MRIFNCLLLKNYYISSKSHFLSSYFYLLVLLITRDAPIFALFALVAATQVQRCCRGAAAVPCRRCQGAAGSAAGCIALQPEQLAACTQRLCEMCGFYVLQ